MRRPTSHVFLDPDRLGNFDEKHSTAEEDRYITIGLVEDVLTIIINQKMGVKELQKMVFAFPTQTYGLISSLIPLFLKKGSVK